MTGVAIHIGSRPAGELSPVDSARAVAGKGLEAAHRSWPRAQTALG
jgi:hypothetical protein